MKPSQVFAAWALAIAILGSAVHSQHTGDTAFLDREVGPRRGFAVGSPLITWMSVLRLFQDLQLPLGFESVEALASGPAPWQETDGTPSALIVTNGLTLRQLLDAIVDADPQYEWRLVDGVVVMRPVAAWADPAHPLHRPVPPVTLDTVNTNGAIDGILKATGQYLRPTVGTTDDVRFSVQFAGGPLLQLLTNVAGAHGTFGWTLQSGRTYDAGARGMVRSPQLQLQGANRVTLKPEGTYVQSVGAVIGKALLPGAPVTDPVTVRGLPRVYPRPAGAYVAGTGAVAGRAHSSGSALPGVRVRITGPGVDIQAVTDGDGNFDVRAPFQAADYEVRLELAGFADIRRSVTAIPMGLVGLSVHMRVCDTRLERVTVDPGLPETLRQSSAVVHFKIATVTAPRPAKEAGEGVCGGQEIEIGGVSRLTAKLVAGFETPRSFVVRSGRTGYRTGQEFLAFLWWNPGIEQYVPGGYMVPVENGRIAWKSDDRSVLRDGMRVADAVAAVRRLARR